MQNFNQSVHSGMDRQMESLLEGQLDEQHGESYILITPVDTNPFKLSRRALRRKANHRSI